MVKTLSLMHAKVEQAQATGRTAVLVRRDGFSPWVQVESIFGREDALEYARQLDRSEEQRAQLVALFAEEDWGEDAPSGQEFNS